AAVPAASAWPPALLSVPFNDRTGAPSRGYASIDDFLAYWFNEWSCRVTEPLTILFMPESAYGPTNNCIGIGNELLRRGHRVVFAAEASWKGKLTALGFEEDLVDLAPPAEDAGDAELEAGACWKAYNKAIGPE